MTPDIIPDFWTTLTILGMAGVTILTRISGILLMRHVVIRGRMAAALEAMPGSVLMAIVTPTAFAAGLPEAIASAITMILAWKLPMLVAVLCGVSLVVVLRLVFI